MKQKQMLCRKCFRIEWVSFCVREVSCRECGRWMKEVVQGELNLKF